jgi:stage II sporulation protein D
VRVRWSAVVLAALLLVLPVPGSAQEEEPATPETVRANTLEIIPVDEEAAVVVDGRRYRGRVRVSGHGDGLAVVETVDLDSYLAGIQEVPFSWEPAALEAQVIAARTYLAWNLARGRTAGGIRYDYDICATDACQVYAGVEPRLAAGGERWLAAVQATEGEILLYDGEPAQTYYSSTSGGRTRTAGDVWPEVDLPYLVAVESPGEESPFVEWMWRLPQSHMQRVLDEAGLLEGDLVDISTTTTEDGEGPWEVTIESEGGSRTLTTWELRGELNGAGPRVLPQHLPGVRPDGPRYPQTILSPTYVLESIRLPLLVPGAPPVLTIYQVDGRGWGHLIGMSQYGAQAMAEDGATATEILSHFYGGLEPQPAPEWVPETVEVVLDVGLPTFEVEVTGAVAVEVDGVEVAAEELGSWGLVADRGAIEVTSPVGLGLAPQLRPGGIALRGGRLVLQPELTSAAEVSWTVWVDGEAVVSSGPTATDAGFFTVPLPLTPGAGIEIEAVNVHGSDRVVVGEVGEEDSAG